MQELVAFKHKLSWCSKIFPGIIIVINNNIVPVSSATVWRSCQLYWPRFLHMGTATSCQLMIHALAGPRISFFFCGNLTSSYARFFLGQYGLSLSLSLSNEKDLIGIFDESLTDYY